MRVTSTVKGVMKVRILLAQRVCAIAQSVEHDRSPIAFSSFLSSVKASFVKAQRDGMRSWRILLALTLAASVCSSCLSELYKSLKALILSVVERYFYDISTMRFKKSLSVCSLVKGIFVYVLKKSTVAGRRAELLHIELKLLLPLIVPFSPALISQEV